MSTPLPTSGGNDSMQTCLQLGQAARDSGYELCVIGVPKTIDNDLPETDHCPGYGSAARFWAVATQEAALDLAAMRGYDTVVVLECMGRNAGWLTAAAALGPASHRRGAAYFAGAGSAARAGRRTRQRGDSDPAAR